jgi:hypothetical protein
MMRKPLIICIGLAGVAVAAVGTYSYKNVERQASLRQGIALTQDSLAKVNDLLNENQAEIVNLMARTEVDLGQQVEDVAQVDVSPKQQVTPLGDAVDAFKTGSNGFEAAKAYQNHDYLQAMGQAAEAVAAVWGKFDPRVKYGADAIDIGANL